MTQKSVEQLTQRWQAVINIIARHYDVPSCLVMKLEDEHIKVHLSSTTQPQDNPYAVGDKEHFKDSGLYCEYVINNQKMLQVSNALTNPEWDHNPDIKLGMIAYLGVPLCWPDKSPFGTLCVLDKKERVFPAEFEQLLLQLSQIFELDLSLAHEIEQRKKAQAELLQAQEKLLTTTRLQHFSQISQGICHELGTPLGTGITISSHIQALLQQALSPETSLQEIQQNLVDIQECNQILQQELERSSRLLANLRQAAQQHGVPQQVVEFDIAQSIDDAWAFLDEQQRQRISLKQLLLLPGPIQCNYAALTGALKQLFLNAAEHAFKQTSNPQVIVKAWQENNHIIIEVQDNGCGMSEELRQSALRPFFSSERNQGKVGLGLNYVSNIIINTLAGDMDILDAQPGTCIRLSVDCAAQPTLATDTADGLQ